MRHGATDVRVFGSFARGEESQGGDLDLLVTLGEGRSLLDLVGLKQDLEDLVHRPVDVVTEKALSPYLRERVLSKLSHSRRYSKLSWPNLRDYRHVAGDEGSDRVRGRLGRARSTWAWSLSRPER